MEVVVVGVLQDPAEEEGPGEVIHSVLLVLHCASADLSHKMVVKRMVKVTLNRERLEQELLVVFLAR